MSFRQTLLDEVLTGQDEKVRAAADEFLGRVTASPKQIAVGSTRVETEPARFLRAARYEDRPIIWAGWIIYNGGGWTCDGPLESGSPAVFVRQDGALLAKAAEADRLRRSSNEHLSERHRVEPHPDAHVWFGRSAGAELGLPFNVHVHNQTHPEISVGRWCSGTATPLTVYNDFDELVQADATATSTWFTHRLAAFLDDPHAPREFWGRPR